METPHPNPSFVQSKARRWWRYLTPAYWRGRRLRQATAREAERLLPTPFEPACIEFGLRKAASIGGANESPLIQGSLAAEEAHEQIRSRLRDRREVALAAGTAGVVAGVDVFEGFSSVDSALLAGVSDQYNVAIDSISDLSQHLNNIDITEGLVDAVKGRMAEHVLFDHLQALGVPAEMAPSPFQEGWDLQIDGIAVNSKLVADASELTGHFDRFPDIPVVVAGDTTHLPADVIHIDSLTGAGFDGLHDAVSSAPDTVLFVDHALSNAAIGHQTATGLEFADSHSSAVGVHFPWVALALSGWREAGLLKRGMTDPAIALKNLSLDLAGTGIGGFAGAKAGALLGAPLGPLGALVGAVFGGVGGAIAGRRITGEFKMAPLKAAIGRLNDAQADVRRTAKTEQDRIDRRMKEARSAEESALQSARQEAKARLAAALSEHARFAGEHRDLNGVEAYILLDHALATLATHRSVIAQRRNGFSLWRRWLWPDARILGCDLAIESIDAATAQIKHWKSDVDAGRPLARAQVYSLLGALGLVEVDVRTALARIEAERKEQHARFEAAARDGLMRMTEMRKSALASLKQLLEEALAAARVALHSHALNAASAQGDVEKEARRLGLGLAN
jgi:hypothetical protein